METQSDVNLMMMNGSRLAIVRKRGYRPDLSMTDVDEALEMLGEILHVTISTEKADIGAGKPVFATVAKRQGKTVAFRGKHNYAQDWKAVVSLSEWNSRRSFLKYALEQADQLSTKDEVLDAIHATTVEELQMKASICGGVGQWKWKSYG